MKIPDPIGTYLPRPADAKLKMLPHMTDVHRPQSEAKPIESGNVQPKTVTIFTGMYIAATNNAIATREQQVTIAFELTLPPIAPATTRPTIMQNQ